jgi:general secretion pathway protein C
LRIDGLADCHESDNPQFRQYGNSIFTFQSKEAGFMNRLLLWLNIFLAAAVAYFSVRAVYTAMQPIPEIQLGRAGLAGAATVPPRKQALKSISAYNNITQRDLFKTGKMAEKSKPAVNVDSLAPTRLKLKLWGTIAGPADQTYAVIEDPKMRRQHLYRIGDMIQAATVKMILREKVVLNVDGRDEVLLIEANHKGTSNTRSPVKPEGVSSATAAPAPPVSGPSQRITLKKEMLEENLEKKDALDQQIRARAHMAGGQPAGIRISGIRPGSVFRKMGLRSGDIIVGIDDTVMESPEDMSGIVEALGRSESISLRIKRRGRPATIDIDIE